MQDGAGFLMNVAKELWPTRKRLQAMTTSRHAVQRMGPGCIVVAILDCGAGFSRLTNGLMLFAVRSQHGG